jgi:hypothetical protein
MRRLDRYDHHRAVPLSLLTCVLGFGFGAVSPVHASAQPAGWRTSGRQILTPDGTPLVISGVNWFGFETKYFVAGDKPLTEAPVYLGEFGTGNRDADLFPTGAGSHGQ